MQTANSVRSIGVVYRHTHRRKVKVSTTNGNPQLLAHRLLYLPVQHMIWTL